MTPPTGEKRSEHDGPVHPPPPDGDPEPGRRAELERSLGLGSALSVGMGTMVGAGIFVFPGIAAGRAGPAATLSFALGALVALLVALPTSELATAMPRSGGGYHFVSRGLGAGWGALAGLGQWIGLVFASAFYLVGAGHYLGRAVEMLGGTFPVPPSAVGFVLAVALTALGLVGTRKSGSLQSGIVLFLLAILSAFLVYGLLRMAGVGAPTAHEPGSFAPFGVLPIFTTGALVFTSYLGFAQIAAVAGEIEDPERNVPLAILGSVLLVGGLYVLTVWVATHVLPPDRLGELAETAMPVVAREMAGPLGAAALVVGGVLATVSSANASILSSSRSVFALGRDGLIPSGAGAVNERFRTPHVALLMAGIPMAALTLMGRLDILAEVASLLHLVLYALVCFSLVALRRRDLSGYRPRFRCPGVPVVPLAGGIGSLALIGFMNPASQLIGGAILLAIFGWRRLYAPSVRLKEVEP